jgi:hypothetical protein
MDKDLIIRARRTNIEEYLTGKGEVLLKEGKQYRVKRHPGLVVSGNKWYSHTLLKGGNTVDYLVEMEGMDFRNAVDILSRGIMSYVQSDMTTRDVKVDIPDRNTNDKRTIAYLVKTRCINAKVIIPLLKQGRIYESVGTHNCVFTGIDGNNRVRYLMQRSTLPGCSLKFESEGSDKRYSFSLEGKSDMICIFESPIDLLSYAVIQNDVIKQKPHMLSLGGVTDIALDSYINRISGIHKMIFCLDSDKAGRDAFTIFNKKYALRGFKVYSHFPEQKDWNQQLSVGIACNSSMQVQN